MGKSKAKLSGDSFNIHSDQPAGIIVITEILILKISFLELAFSTILEVSHRHC